MISHMSQPSEAPEPVRSLRHSSSVSSPATARKRAAEGEDDMFSPTSAAALALSSLHSLGAQRDSNRAQDLRGVQLFNSNSNSNTTNGATKAYSTSYRSTSPSPYATAAPHSYEQHGNYVAPVADHSRPTWGAPPSSHPGHPTYAQPPRYQPYNQAQQPEIANSTARHSPTQDYPYPDDQHNSSYHKHQRTSPVPMVGPTPTPTNRTRYNLPTRQVSNANDTSKFSRLASCASSLVTPTPKKAKLEHNKDSAKGSNYSRKKKSLGILAENFLNNYQNLPKGSTIIVDEAAVDLGVERRRIYDVVNILESICLVCKKHKNTYTWMGMDHLDAVFGRLQSQAIAEYPEDAERFLGSRDRKTFLPVPLKPPRKQSKTRENKSLAKLSQEFLQVFLVGHVTLSLPEASDKIQGTTSMEELIAMGSNGTGTTPIAKNAAMASNEKELKAAAARGLKTKIRRLYDIANVFLSVGLLKKVDGTDSSRRPNFSWCYRLTAKELYQANCPKLQGQPRPPPVTSALAPRVVSAEVVPTVSQDTSSDADETEKSVSTSSSPVKQE